MFLILPCPTLAPIIAGSFIDSLSTMQSTVCLVVVAVRARALTDFGRMLCNVPISANNFLNESPLQPNHITTYKALTIPVTYQSFTQWALSTSATKIFLIDIFLEHALNFLLLMMHSGPANIDQLNFALKNCCYSCFIILGTSNKLSYYSQVSELLLLCQNNFFSWGNQYPLPTTPSIRC